MEPSLAAAHVFVADLATPVLDEDDRHHITRVLRVGPGATVTAADGQGSWRPCRLTRSGGLEPVGEVTTEPGHPPVTVAFSLVKGQRPEMVVQKLTELGVDRIVPFVAERSVVRWDGAKTRRHMDRFAEIARQAAMQSRRIWLPAVGWESVTAAVRDRGTDLGTNARPPSGTALPGFQSVSTLSGVSVADIDGDPPMPGASTILIGPEGGWTSAERDVGLPCLRLAPHVLRAETAAITAGALLVALRSDIVLPSVPVQVVGLHRS